MTIASWRRFVVLGSASLLLHYLAARWVGQGPAARPSVPGKAAPVIAALRAPEPAAQSKGAAAVEASAAVPARQVQSARKGGGGRRYRASLPPPAALTLDVSRIDAQGGSWTGQAVLEWRLDGAAYSLQYRGGLAEMASEGRVGAAGIIPRTMTEKRRNRARTATHFDERGNITFSAAQKAVPMQRGAQDRATLPLQLAAIARADARQLAAGVAILVGAEKDATLYRFVVQGQEEIDTGVGKLATWRLARVPQPGSYNARLDIWLAPGYEWYPVQLRSTEANGTVTTQTIRRIVATDAGN